MSEKNDSRNKTTTRVFKVSGWLAFVAGLALIFFELGAYKVLKNHDTVYFNDASPDEIANDPENTTANRIKNLIGLYQPEPRNTVSGHYLAGRFAAVNNDITQAASEMSEVLTLDPDNQFLIYRAFPMFLSEGEVEKSLELAYMLDEGNVLISHLATTLQVADAFKTGDIISAEALIESYDQEGFGEYLRPLSDAWLEVMRGNESKALRVLRENRVRSKDFSTVYDLHIAFVYDYMGNNGEAEKYYKMVLSNHKSVRTVSIMLNFYERIGALDKAEEVLAQFEAENSLTPFTPTVRKRWENGQLSQKAFVDSPTDGLRAMIYDLAGVLNQDSSNKLGLMYGRIAEYLDPSNEMVKLLIADMLVDLGKPSTSLEYLASIRNGSDFYAIAQVQIADILSEYDKTEDAIAILEQLARDVPDLKTRIAVTVGDLLRHIELYQRAIEYYNSAISEIDSLEKDDWRLFYSRGIAYEQSGDWINAEADLEKALELHPDQPYVLNYLGYSWADKGVNQEKALEYITRAIALRPNDGYILDSMGWVLYRMNRAEEAINFMEKATMLVPNDPVINDHLGDVYWSVGRRVEANYQWERALQYATSPEDVAEIEKKLIHGIGTSKHVITKQAEAKNSK